MKTPKILLPALLITKLALVNLVAQPVPANLGVGDIIPELVWADGSIKQNVKVVNNVAGRVILSINGVTEAIKLDDFRKMVERTNSSLDAIKAEQAEQSKMLEEEAKTRADTAAAAAAAAAFANPIIPTAQLPATPSLSTEPPTLATKAPVTTAPVTTAPANPFGTAPAPEPLPVAPAPMASQPENPFGAGAVVTPPTTPTSATTPEPSPISAAPPVPTPPASEPAPSRPPRPQPVIQAAEPYEVRLLRSSIHDRMFKLQDNYIASLEDLRISSQGDPDKASQIEAAIQAAEEQKARLQNILRKGSGGKGGKFKGGPAGRFLEEQQERALQTVAPVAPPSPAPIEPSSLAPVTTEPSQEPQLPPKPDYLIPPVEVTGKPVQEPSGVVPSVMASIVAEGQPGLLAKNIEKWGPLQQEGSHWTVEVDYMADSIFGIFPSRAKAYVQQNKVVKWETLPRP